ncbi:MAG: radical SAM protein [Candidatus Saccharibacteria bacterium]|nr:radical SAM protein [Candidatus Saccharibacteria bacterium]
MDKFDFICRPKMSWLTVNRQCNFRCPWCYGEDTHYEPKDTMSLAMAKELTRINLDVGVRYTNIIGGEPTLWPSLFEFNEYCRQVGMSTCLVTNAARFGDDSFWDAYRQSPSDEVSVSVKTVDRDEFKFITKSRLFDQTMRGIERAIGFHSAGASTVYNSLVGLDGLKRIALRCKELGASYFVVDLCTPVVSKDGVLPGFSIEPTQLAKDIMVIQPYLDELYDGKVEIAIYIPLCLFPEAFVELMMEKRQLTTICHVYDRSGLNFDVNGDVMVCNQLFDSYIARKATDYEDGTDLMKQINSKAVRNDYRQLLRYPADTCSDCRWNLDCRGGCLLNWVLYDSSICHAVAKANA